MTVDLHTKDSSLPYYDPFLLQDANKFKINVSVLNTIPRDFGSHTRDPLLNSTELSNQMHMSHFMLQEGHKFDLPALSSQNLESQCDSINWPASSTSAYNVVGMLEKMKLDESGSYEHHSEFIPSTNVDVGASSYQSLVYEQIRANQLSKLKQEQIVSLKKKLAVYRENNGHISQQFQKKDERAYVGFGKGRKALSHTYGSSGTYCNTSSTSGTGVFLPRGTSSALFDSHRRPGKGCSTVLIPARVVQALQLHFDQIAATSGPKSPAFPPLHDVLVSNSDGMYSLQKQRQSRKKPAHIHN